MGEQEKEEDDVEEEGIEEEELVSSYDMEHVEINRVRIEILN